MPKRMYIHPDSPATGEQWMQKVSEVLLSQLGTKSDEKTFRDNTYNSADFKSRSSLNLFPPKSLNFSFNFKF